MRRMLTEEQESNLATAIQDLTIAVQRLTEILVLIELRIDWKIFQSADQMPIKSLENPAIKATKPAKALEKPIKELPEAKKKSLLDTNKALKDEASKADIISVEPIEEVGKSWKIFNDKGQVAYIGKSLIEDVGETEIYLKKGSKWVKDKINWKEDEQ